MPEGDSIFRAAARIRAACAGLVVVAAETHAPGPAFGRLVGDTLTTVDTHGKNLFLRFASGLGVHVHLRMLGSARVVLHEGGAADLHGYRAFIGFADRSIVVRRAPLVRLMSAREVDQAKRALGADALGQTFDTAAVVEKMRARTDTLGEALVDQRLVAGVGNILKSESLFLAKTSPFLVCASCTESELARVIDTARETMERSVAKRGGASRFDDAAPFAARARLTRDRRDPYRADPGRDTTWVYLRRGEPCFVCRTPIAMRHQGVPPRSTYFCPRCQGVVPAPLGRRAP